MKMIERIKSLFRTIENPATPLSDPDDWLTDMWGGKSSSGIMVNSESALTYAAVWRAVNLIARDVAKLPIGVFQRLPGGGKESLKTHPAHKILKRKPNEFSTAFTIKQTLMSHVLLRGNAYAQIGRDSSGVPRSLWVLDPDRMTPIKEDGSISYAYRKSSDNDLTLFGHRDIFHLRGMGFDGLTGYSVIAKARESLGLGMAARDYGSFFFSNNARPSVVIEHPGTLTAKAANNLKESWNRMHAGLESSHKTAVLEEGMKLSPFSINARDAQLIESREFEIREVANWFGVPPHKLGDATRTAFASLEQENQSYLDEAIDVWLVNFEEEATDKLISDHRSDVFCEFNRSALVRADMAARFAAYNVAITGGWMSRDEVRDRENMNPIPGGEGKVFLLATNNMEPVGQSKEDPEPDDDEDEKDDERALPLKVLDAHRQLISNAVGKVVGRVNHQSDRARAKGKWDNWIEDVASLRSTFENIVYPMTEAWSCVGGVTISPDLSREWVTFVVDTIGEGEVDTGLATDWVFERCFDGTTVSRGY